MAQTLNTAKKQLEAAIINAVNKAMDKEALIKAELPRFVIEAPADRKNGDLATNAAMAGARAFKTAPVKIAQAIKENIELQDTFFEKCEIAGVGFINFFYSADYYASVLKEVLEEKESYGSCDCGKGKRVLVEFVSANPTGPMHMGNARGGAIGDCLASVLNRAGFEAHREFYVNDAGNQIEKFANSLEARYMQIYKTHVNFPEDGYQGEDIKEHAEAYAEQYGDSLVSADPEYRRKALVDYALPKNIEKMQRDMKRYKINYDRWFFESELHRDGKVKEVVDILEKKGLTYEKDGALWYRNKEVCTEILLKEGKTQDYIDKLELKDDVLIRNNGNPTYFAADIAYHKDKFDRGYDTCVDVWGADHHGHVMRMKGAMNAIGYDGDRLKVVLMQLVKLVQGGEVVKMSKRTGKAIQLGDLLDEVPVDSARFLFNTREANTQMDFDLDIAVQQDNQNPVYYVQYAHARICSIIKALAKDGISPGECSAEELKLLTQPEERELINHLAQFSEEIISAAGEYDPTKITRYVTQTATLFHKFYNACRVRCDNESLMQARLSLCLAVKTVIKNVLDMFNISCPESM